jgi:hypothetical protein
MNLFLNKKSISLGINENMKVSFNTSDTVSGAVSEANIEIIGLRREDISLLATSANQFDANYIQNRIDIVAGYQLNYGRIFSGNIIEANAEMNNPNYSVKIKAVSSFFESLDVPLPLPFEGKTNILDIVNKIANKLNIPLNNSLKNTYFVENYSYSDSITEHIRRLSAIADIDLYQSNGELFIKEKSQPLNLKSFLVSWKSNLVGSPSPNPTGCDATIRLNPSIKTGQTVKIESIKHSELNANDYVLMTLHHSGDTRGNNWNTHLKLIKQSIYGKQ